MSERDERIAAASDPTVEESPRARAKETPSTVTVYNPPATDDRNVLLWACALLGNELVSQGGDIPAGAGGLAEISPRDAALRLRDVATGDDADAINVELFGQGDTPPNPALAEN